MEAPNKPVPLYSGPVTLRARRPGAVKPLTVDAGIALEWSPHPVIRLRAPSHVLLYSLGDVLVRLDDLDWTGTGHLSGDGSGGLVGRIDPITGWRKRGADRLTRIVAHVPNMRRFCGAGLQDATARWSGRNVAVGGGWRLTVDGLPDHKAIWQPTLGAAGFRFTHTVSLERVSGASFPEGRARRALDIVHQFLSFAQGAWTGPMLAVGFDDAGTRVWEEWAIWKLVRAQDVRSWAPTSGSGFEAFAGFWKVATSRFDREYRRALGFYVEANRMGSLEPALIVGQASLELLAWLELVHVRGAMTAKDADALQAHDRIRRGLESLEVPRAIPSALTRLHRVSRRERWDFAQALTIIRNRMVHPPKPQRRLEGRGLPFLVDLWELTQRNLALALLRHYGFQGSYHDRVLHRGAPDERPVPWA
jgi:hypothetical protein